MDGRPIQLVPSAVPKGRHLETPLEIAIARENHAVVLLLLCNGYDPNGDKRSSLQRAVESRSWPIVDLLWEWGADPRQVYAHSILDSYNSALIERFYAAGADLTESHEMAAILGMGTSNRPLYGFARKHRQRDPKVQRELDMALGAQVERNNEKGVALCLWAGANPHTPVPSVDFPIPGDDEEEDADEDRFRGWSAVHRAGTLGRLEILKRLGPDATRDDIDSIYQWTSSSTAIAFLASISPPTRIATILRSQLFYLKVNFPLHQNPLGNIEAIFKSGARWVEGTREQIADVRRELLRAGDQDFVRAMQILGVQDRCSPEVLQELARTPGMRDRMRDVGLIPWEEPSRKRRGYYFEHVTHAREIARNCGLVAPIVPRPVPPKVEVRSSRAPSSKVSLSREDLYERVWSEPVERLAKTWGLSGRGLAKLCARMGVPVPPRGYWAKLQNGQHVTRTPLDVATQPSTPQRGQHKSRGRLPRQRAQGAPGPSS
jgi:hypothetical protein